VSKTTCYEGPISREGTAWLTVPLSRVLNTCSWQFHSFTEKKYI
jgi:hypothetical protein